MGRRDPRTSGAGPAESAIATILWPGSFLWYAMAACTLFLHTVSVLAPWLIAEFGFSRVQLGAISTVTFSCAAITSLLTGHLVDRHGTRRAMWGLFALNGGAFVTLGLSPAGPWVFLGAVLGGVGTALGNPATNQVISTSVERARRGLLVGIKQAGVPSSAFLAGAVLPPVAIAFGWRTAVFVAFVFTVMGAAITVRLPRPGSTGATSDEPTRDLGEAARPILMLTIYVFLVGSGISAVQTYIVLFGVEELGLLETAAGWGAALVGMLGIVSRVFAAPIAQRFARPSIPLLLVAAGALISSLLLLLAPVYPALFFVGAAGVGLTALAGNSVAHLMIVTELPQGIAGKASGAVQTGFYAGFILFPLVFGWIVDRTEAYWQGWLLVAAWFLAACVVPLLSWHQGRGSPTGDVNRPQTGPGGS